MYNLYQSAIRQHIQTHIYRKPVFHIDFLGQNLFGMIKQKKVGPLSVQRYQLLGVRIQDFLHRPDEIKQAITQLKQTLGSGYGDMFIQLGLIDQLCQYHTTELKDPALRSDIRNRRTYIEEMLAERFGLRTTVRENMPMATLTLDCTLGRDAIQKGYSTSCRAHIKKAHAQHFYFEVQPSRDDVASFFQIRQETMMHKGIHTITETMYYQLLDYLSEGKKGGLYLVKKNNAIVSGSICLIDGPVMLYLYGASDRNRGNTGGHHFLKTQLIHHAILEGLTMFDFFGTAPSGYDDHHLSGVSRFKESFGGIKTEYYGSYDIVSSPILYQMMSWRTS